MFEPVDTCKMLLNAVFDCHQQDNDQVDRYFYDKVMEKLQHHRSRKQEGNEELRKRSITVEEEEGTISRLTSGMTPGSGMFST